MTPFELLSLTIAIIALGISIWATVRSNKLGVRQNQLQEKLFALEASRERDRQVASRSATLRAWIEHGRDYRLMIVNEGPSEARSLKTLIDAGPVLSHPLVSRGLEEITGLGPGATASYLLAVAGGTKPILSISLSWEDDSGKPGQWSSQLNLF
jgi:hypothetical protein